MEGGAKENARRREKWKEEMKEGIMKNEERQKVGKQEKKKKRQSKTPGRCK